MSYLNGKVVVITGAGGGFGRLVAEKSAARGAKIVGADINAEALLETQARVEAAGGSARTEVTDVSDLGQMKSLARAALEAFGQIDIWINNAGIMPLAFFSDHEQAVDAWSRCIDINIKGVMNGIIAAHDPMIEAGRGHVVNLSSIYSNFPVVGAAVYGASKAAVNFLSESLRVETQGKIKVTIVRPTGVPATGLAGAVVNPDAVVGILGQNTAAYGQQMAAFATGDLPAELADSDNVEYLSLAPEHLADQIIYAIDQPWGVSIGDITVRASGDGYIL
ncbi:MAG: SDR family oxidoreductase [Pseudomonadaceae bacterium]|nr:SDR family oxidoreductase [Pseudomonadaceae bacterium]